MKPYDTSGMLENDDELESVLREYFQQEMPPELQELSDVSDEEFEKRLLQRQPVGNVNADPFTSRRHRAFKIGLLTSAVCACLALGMGLLQFLPEENPAIVDRVVPVSPANDTAPPARGETDESEELDSNTLVVVDHGNSPMDLTPKVDKNVKESIDITLYNTELGPVEQRTELSWTNITVENPQTGSNVKMSMPELTIDFVPVDKGGLSLIGDESGGNGQ
ncbi:hypothetical protein [Gimesia sp.]|uniref:hypothetical protein n=1 Tax=Gimesia sp. TaxID=2024833 RepID=UPI000C455E4E|nr:hypothetical protein [Gimesia sp.]MAX36280.1 hypothetical protein [Gimesia sp.]HAH45968.1 hypothetical protein [Planctomycetaceae bacterium]|tara:strand:- start:4177 stop:4839 length:663 start_codon:yes stop_codon:yes gene_type:complete